VIAPELLTLFNIDSLNTLEPCGNGCPKPVLVMENLTVDRISQVGGGRHMRMRLRSARQLFNAIYFSATPESASIAEGDLVDVAFIPQVNDFRGERTPQMNITDIRPACNAQADCCCTGYRELQKGTVIPETVDNLLPDRATLGLVWRYLAGCGKISETPMCLLRKIVRWSGKSLSLGMLLTCLDIFSDVGLISIQRLHKYITVELLPCQQKADLSTSKTMQLLQAAKAQ
jgi:single-stranded-DNA-specific exonuclease